MGRKGIKIPNETKLKYAKLCFEKKMSKCEAARQTGTCDSDVGSWVYRYSEQGELAFLDTGKNNIYPAELKIWSSVNITDNFFENNPAVTKQLCEYSQDAANNITVHTQAEICSRNSYVSAWYCKTS